jgi:MFS family permease
VIGTALAAAVAGALLGPVLGALAAEVGTGPVFGSVLLIAVVFAMLAARLPEAGEREEQGLREIAATMLSRPVVLGTALVTVPSVMFGAVDVLVPLRISELGGGHAAIAAGFVAGAALESATAPLAGRYSDRVGRRNPYTVGLAICAVAMALIAVAETLGLVITGLVVTSFGAGLCFTPAMALLSESAEATGLHQGFAAGLSNMAWASGQVIGGAAGGAVASVTNNAVPSLAVATLLLLTVAYARRTLAPRPEPAPG